jgi:hypothetical protein
LAKLIARITGLYGFCAAPESCVIAPPGCSG